MNNGLSVAIVGATGAVGQEFLRLFEQRNFPVGSLKLLASARSAGTQIKFRGDEHRVEETTTKSFDGVDIAFFSAGASTSRKFVPAAVDAGALVIDNSSAFRTDPTVPLVIPEVNPDSFGPSNRLFAVPNCCAVILLMAVNPLRSLGKIDRLIVSTYQSASGGGAGMMRLLQEETEAMVLGKELPKSPINTRYAYNLFSHNTPINDQGYSEEEAKVMVESRKILGMPDLKMNVTCIRVPVLRAHTESVTIEFADKAPTIDDARAALAAAPGVRVVDDRANNHFPTPLEASGQDNVLVGRIRHDLSNPNALCLLASGDQLLKGAGLNAIQIAELVLGQHSPPRLPRRG